ncbi:hypothetical protein HK101_010989 [Irineochytrium annulatum]|nr:hypothetical protein HK101_010989 [Irineochytrium annulatum]
MATSTTPSSPSDLSAVFLKLEEEAQFYKRDSWDTAQSLLRIQAQFSDIEAYHRKRQMDVEARLDLTARHASHLRAKLDSSIAEIESLKAIVLQQQHLILQQQDNANVSPRCCSRSSSMLSFDSAGDENCSCNGDINDRTLCDVTSVVSNSSFKQKTSTNGSANSRSSPKWLAKIKNALVRVKGTV